MDYKPGRPTVHRALRNEAERSAFDGGDEETTRLMHELQVHQLELEMQNDELRRAQAELAESRDRYLELYDLAPVAYLTLDASGRIVEANLSAATLLNRDRDRLIGLPLAAFMVEAHADTLHTHLRDAFESGRQQACEVVLGPCARDREQAESRRVPVHLTSIGNSDVITGVKRCRTALIDLSSLQKVQARNHALEGAIRSSESRFREIADRMEDMLAVVERTPLRLEYVNPAFEQVLGRRFEQLAVELEHWRQSVHSADCTRLETAYAAFVAGSAFDEEFRLVRHDGDVRWVRARVFAIPADEDKSERHVALIQDITANRQLESELRQAQKMEAVGALASGVAHDFNNVLQAVLGCITLAQRPDASDEAVETYLDQAADAARRGGGLSERLMRFAHKRELDAGTSVIDDVIARCASLLERLLTEQVTLELCPGAGGATVRADAVQIEQILMNLAANAHDAMPNGGRLRIRTRTVAASELRRPLAGLRPAEQYVRIQIDDTGCGMDAELVTRIFEPFFTTKGPGQGTGLGLATVFSVTRGLGGHVQVESQAGRGTTFTIHFPSCPSTAAAPVEASVALHRLTGTVLLVEDETVVRQTVCHYLQELGIDVLEASNAGDATRVLQSANQVDLLLTDVLLPDMRGTSLAELASARCPGLRVLFMTANPELLERGGAGTGHPVLRKPFRRDELAQQIAALLPAATDPDTALPEPTFENDADEPQHAAPSPDAAPEPRVVLLVDDHDVLRHALQYLLEDAGYHVLAASSPSEALSMAHSHECAIDLLVTDLDLPEMEGSRLARRLKRMCPELRILLMSGAPPEAGSRWRCLQKPVDPNRLLAVIADELR